MAKHFRKIFGVIVCRKKILWLGIVPWGLNILIGTQLSKYHNIPKIWAIPRGRPTKLLSQVWNYS